MTETTPYRPRRRDLHMRVIENEGKPCDWSGCGYRRQGLGRLCAKHDKRAEDTGHPEGRNYRATVWRPYVFHAATFIELHRDHPGIVAGLRWCQEELDRARWIPVANSRGRPHATISRHLHRALQKGASAKDMLARVFAAYLAYEAGPGGMFRDDRHFRHQLALLVLRLGSGAKVNGGKNGGRMGVAVREAVAHRLCSALGLLALNAAKAMAPSLPGVPIPERAPPRVDGSFHSFSILQHGDCDASTRS